MKIGIIGASSQVGSSVAIYLKLMGFDNATCFVRSKYSNVLFQMFNIPFEQIDYNNKQQLSQTLQQYDLIADFTYPAGQLFEIPKLIEKNTEAIISCMKPNSAYVYMSSIMAYGTPIEDNYISNYIIPRSSYAFIKRKAEATIKKYCSKHNIKPYLFRLGQVHGFLQSVSHSYKKNLSKDNEYLVNGTANDATNTIFISTLCEALINCAEGKAAPGLYTLVSEPQWTLQHLYEYYTSQYNYNCQIKFSPFPAAAKNKTIKDRIKDIAKRNRALIENYILINRPALMIKMKGNYRITELKAAVANKAIQSKDYNLLGKPAHASVAKANADYNTIKEIEQKIETAYNAVIESHTHEF